jgi:phospholipase/lecithinase/hemolysin
MHMHEHVSLPRAKVLIHVERAYDFDERTGLWMRRQVEDDEIVHNIITDVGRVTLHTYCYGTAARTNGLNYIALSNSAGPPAASDTVLAGELAADGLARAQGTVVPPTGSGNQTTVSKAFTYVGVAPQAVQMAALFDAASVGNMAHEIQYSQRTLFTNDLITIQYTITLG